MFSHLQFLGFFVVFGFCAGEPTKVEFWPHPYYWGSSYVVNINESQCYTFPKDYHDVSSLNPYGKCISFYNKDNCTGESMAKNSPVDNLLRLNFNNDKLRSFQLCSEQLAEKVEKDSATATVHFWEQYDYKGERLSPDLKKNECYTLPVAWRDRVASFNPAGYCIMVYKFRDCRGTFVQSSLKLYDLAIYRFANAIRSVKLCPSQDVTLRPKPMSVTTTASPNITNIPPESVSTLSPSTSVVTSSTLTVLTSTSVAPPSSSSAPLSASTDLLSTSTDLPSTSSAPLSASTDPPSTSTAPPSTTMAPLSASSAPPSTSADLPATSTAPPSTSTAPPSTSTAPLSASTAPPSSSTAPLSASTDLPSTSTAPPSTPQPSCTCSCAESASPKSSVSTSTFPVLPPPEGVSTTPASKSTSS